MFCFTSKTNITLGYMTDTNIILDKQDDNSKVGATRSVVTDCFGRTRSEEDIVKRNTTRLYVLFFYS